MSAEITCTAFDSSFVAFMVARSMKLEGNNKKASIMSKSFFCNISFTMVDVEMPLSFDEVCDEKKLI